ncbi:hypothetical protein WIW50_20215 [Flavobacteriaceae bacterium 3-367]
MDQENVEKQVEETLEAASRIAQVKAPPFFKEGVLNRMRTGKGEEERPLIPWFTPKYQVAALICIIMVNAFVLLWYASDNYDQSVANFAQAYGISNSDNDSFFNVN